jgi:hypothetical protein
MDWTLLWKESEKGIGGKHVRSPEGLETLFGSLGKPNTPSFAWFSTKKKQKAKVNIHIGDIISYIIVLF